MINWIRIWPWKKIKELEEEIADLQCTVEDHSSWYDAAEAKKDQYKAEADDLRKENYNLRSETSTFRAALRDFKQICEQYE